MGVLHPWAMTAQVEAIETPAPRSDDVSPEAKALRQARWSAERAWAYMAKFGAIKGCNYVPADASSIWQAENETKIDRELGWAEDVTLNSVRVFLPSLLYENLGDSLFQRVDRFLDLAAKHKMSVILTLSVTRIKDPSYKSTEPFNENSLRPEFQPGVHGGVARPHPGIISYRKNLPAAKRIATDFVKAVLRRYGQDQRIIAWDLFNEPWLEDRPMVEHVFSVAREQNPSQPLTACWQGEDLSDVYNFHTYGRPGNAKGSQAHLLPFDIELQQAVASGRPLLCTECLARTFGNTFEAFLPYFSKYKVGWYIWGLCAGTAQHYFPWGWPEGSPEPKNWFHCILYPDGSAYRDSEIELIRKFKYAT